MLDTDAPGTSTPDGVPEDAEGAAPQPPRRRRAASRPAGPPAVLPATVPPRELIAAPEPAAIERVEPAFVEADLVESADAAPQPPAPQKPARAPRKRVSRPAGPPAEQPPAPPAPVEQAPAEPEATTEEAPAEAPGAAEPEASAEPGEPARADEGAVEDEDVAASLAALQRSRTTRRRTTRRTTQAPEGALGATDVAGALDNLAAALASARGADVDEDEPEVLQAPDAEAEPGEEPTAPKAAEPEGEPADEAEAQHPEQEDQGLDEPEDEPGADDEPDADDETEVAEDAEGDEALARRRRRRRGGRRRRRPGERETDAEGDTDEATDGEEPAGAADEEADVAEGEPVAEGAGRRRRRRRRRGEDGGEEAVEDGVDVVVRVREPRRTRTEPSDQVTGIEGSTRLEAKRQRRREGRAAGRRRAPILSESEFLARREAVDRTMLIRQREDYTQIGVLEDGILVEHYVDRDSSASMIGNIYLGRVQNVLPSMEAAFVDIGRGRNAVLYAGEVDWDAFGAAGGERKVERVLKSGQAVLVQVTKDPVGAKGARLTSHISVPGRYVVYSPGGQLSGISRKLPENERARLKGILDALVGENASVIVRTAAEGASEEELVRDVNRLKAQWEIIQKKVAQGNSPQLLYSEPDLTVRIVRDLFTEDFSTLVVDGNGQGSDAYETVQAYVTHVAPHLQERLVHWNRWTDGDLFEHHRVDEQVAKALERKVHLPSGGSLIIDRTEAMTVIDVNTGKFTGTQGNLEATVTSNNLEAAEEVVRQLRLRDIGGIIVIDFIDMVLPANRELLLRRLVECLGRDRTRHQVAEVTSLGLVQMTRKKIGTGLHEAFTVPCETCHARGYHIHEAPVGSQAPADGGEREQSSRRGRGPRRDAGQGHTASD